MRYGFDFHGVLDIKSDKFRIMAKDLVSNGHQVHILTGSTEQHWLEESKDLLQKDVHYTHFFSVADYLKAIGIKGDESYKNPKYDEEYWNSAKGEYAFYAGLSEHYDDCAEYAKHFPKSCKFHLVVNGEVI